MRTRAEWVQIVAAWRRSGQTAREYARLLDAQPATLKWWASRLHGEDRQRARAGARQGRQRSSNAPGLARVRVVEGTASASAEARSAEAHGGLGLELETGRGVLRAYGQEATRSLGSALEALLVGAS